MNAGVLHGYLPPRVFVVDRCVERRLARIIDWTEDDWLFSRAAALAFAAREARKTGEPRYVNAYCLALNERAYIHQEKTWGVFLGGRLS